MFIGKHFVTGKDSSLKICLQMFEETNFYKNMSLSLKFKSLSSRE